MDDVPTSKVARFRVCRFPGQIAAQWGMTFACKSVKIVLRVDDAIDSTWDAPGRMAQAINGNDHAR